MATGTVKWFGTVKRASASYSLMTAAQTFSFSAVECAGLHDLREAQKVSYEITELSRHGQVLG